MPKKCQQLGLTQDFLPPLGFFLFYNNNKSAVPGTPRNLPGLLGTASSKDGLHNTRHSCRRCGLAVLWPYVDVVQSLPCQSSGLFRVPQRIMFSKTLGNCEWVEHSRYWKVLTAELTPVLYISGEMPCRLDLYISGEMTWEIPSVGSQLRVTTDTPFSTGMSRGKKSVAIRIRLSPVTSTSWANHSPVT